MIEISEGKDTDRKRRKVTWHGEHALQGQNRNAVTNPGRDTVEMTPHNGTTANVSHQINVAMRCTVEMATTNLEHIEP